MMKTGRGVEFPLLTCRYVIERYTFTVKRDGWHVFSVVTMLVDHHSEW